MKETIVIIASTLAIIGNIPYARDVIKGKITPHAYTWFLWSIVSLVTFFGQVQAGAGIGAIPTLASEIFTILIFIFSLKNGFKYTTHSDTIFLIIALLGLIPWIYTKDPTLSVVIVVIIDAIAFIPTIRKAYKNPGSENVLLFQTNALRHTLALFTLQNYNIATTFHSIVMIITNTIITGVILKQKSKRSH